MTGMLLLLIMLVLLSGVFSSSELAMFSMSELKISHLAEKKVKGAALLKRLREDSHKLLITILIGNNIVNIASASIATALAINLFNNAGVGIATGVMTLVILVAGEIVPKAFATRNAQSISLFMARPLNFLMKVCYPLVYVFDKLTSHVLPDDDGSPLMTEEEVREMVRMSEKEGSIKQQEKEMIQNIFNLDDTTAEDVMTPRPDVFALQRNLTVEQVVMDIKENGYSRVPIFDADLDQITGVLYAKDLLTAKPYQQLYEIARPALFVPDCKKIDLLLREFKHKKNHIAVVVNEHGTMVGIVTIEDLLEEIVGEIYDETDSFEDIAKDIKKINSKEFIIKGRAELKDVAKELQVRFLDNEHTTLSGLLMERLKRVPESGAIYSFKGYQFNVRKVDHNRIEEVFVRRA